VEAAQKAVHELKTQPSVEVALPYLTADANGPKHLEARLTREMIEELVK
jgi:molecular chaperone DnaK (HSP70)